jgi:hypothetical protein
MRIYDKIILEAKPVRMGRPKKMLEKGTLSGWIGAL